MTALGAAGLQDARILHRFDCFRGTSKAATARKFGVRGVNVGAIKHVVVST